jgi:adenylate kinase
MKIVLLGPPGSGKGTQGARLEKDFGFKRISVGDILRKHVAEEGDLGKRIKSFIEKGEMVPDEIIFKLIEKDLCHKDIIFDGIPRNLRQAETLDKILAERNERIDVAILINTPEDEILKRLTSRRVCRECWEVYNLITNPPKTEGICDRCGGILYQREDDKEDVVKHRLEVYRSETEPLIEFYSRQGKLIVINGRGSPEDVYEGIRRALELDNPKVQA